MYHEELAKFRKNRNLDKNAGDLFGNVYKELGEVYDEIAVNNTLGIIEEFADVIIFCENYLATIKHCGISLTVCGDSSAEYEFKSCVESNLDFYNNGGIWAVEDIMISAANAIVGLGFNVEKVVYEKAKLINSRKGEWNEARQKWLKDENQDKSLMYKPDYESCKLN